jgi:hypothetical protein
MSISLAALSAITFLNGNAGGGGGGGSASLNTEGIIAWLLTYIVPLLIVGVGVWIITQSQRGKTSRVITATGILIWGLVIVGGAGVIAAFGNEIASVAFNG